MMKSLKKRSILTAALGMIFAVAALGAGIPKGFAFPFDTLVKVWLNREPTNSQIHLACFDTTLSYAFISDSSSCPAFRTLDFNLARNDSPGTEPLLTIARQYCDRRDEVMSRRFATTEYRIDFQGSTVYAMVDSLEYWGVSLTRLPIYLVNRVRLVFDTASHLPESPEPTIHYPLSLGNRWSYATGKFGVVYGTFYRAIVGDTLMPNGKSYRVIAPIKEYQRQEGNRVYHYVGRELLKYDFSSNPVEYDTIFGRRLRVFHSHCETIADSIGWYGTKFACGYSFGHTAGGTYLTECKIDGYTEIERTRPGRQSSGAFKGSVHASNRFVRFQPIGKPIHGVSIYDVFGRTIWKWQGKAEGPVIWNRPNIRSGVYTARINGAETGESLRFLVLQ